jgi:tRNA nucleotidyltransferase (CCA-adding enzyme)
VIALFKKTIPTGLQHGTVTVRVRGLSVEVTTFRGEGAYSDARRPDTVTFGVPLDEDLARRDLVVNAIAYDPVHKRVHDPFGGRADLAAQRLRAVGDPVARFTEDGLRVMRAVRFAATLEFALDPETEAAIPIALPSLRKVSQERVQVELAKLLGAPRPSIGLAIARRTGILDVIAPEITVDDWPWVDAARGLAPRLAVLFARVPPDRADAALRRLKFSNSDRELAVKLVRVATLVPADERAVRRALAPLGRAAAEEVPNLWREAPRALAVAILARRDALAIGELAIGGEDLMRELGLAPGRAIGDLLKKLVDRVIDDPSLNSRERLLQLARES